MTTTIMTIIDMAKTNKIIYNPTDQNNDNGHNNDHNNDLKQQQ